MQHCTTVHVSLSHGIKSASVMSTWFAAMQSAAIVAQVPLDAAVIRNGMEKNGATAHTYSLCFLHHTGEAICPVFSWRVKSPRILSSVSTVKEGAKKLDQAEQTVPTGTSTHSSALQASNQASKTQTLEKRSGYMPSIPVVQHCSAVHVPLSQGVKSAS